MRRLILSVAVMLLLTTSTAYAQRAMRPVVGNGTALPEQPYNDKWALLIGTNDYPNLPVQYQLSYAENDVRALREVLMEQYQFPESNITTLTNEQATYQNIRDRMGQLSDPGRIDENDCVLIYFSGHGQTVPLPREGNMGFILPHDADVDMDNVDSPAA